MRIRARGPRRLGLEKTAIVVASRGLAGNCNV